MQPKYNKFCPKWTTWVLILFFFIFYLLCSLNLLILSNWRSSLQSRTKYKNRRNNKLKCKASAITDQDVISIHGYWYPYLDYYSFVESINSSRIGLTSVSNSIFSTSVMFTGLLFSFPDSDICCLGFSSSPMVRISASSVSARSSKGGVIFIALQKKRKIVISVGSNQIMWEFALTKGFVIF